MAVKKAKTRFAMPELGQTVNLRPARVADAIRKEIAMLLIQKLKDPRLERVSISGVDVSPDLKNARILYSCPSEDAKSVQAGLLSASGFVRSYLAKIMSMRYMPKLLFVRDLAIKKQEDLERLFREIENERKKTSE